MSLGTEPAARKPDRIVVLDEEGRGSRTLSTDAFAKLKLDERVRLILGKRLRFYAGSTEIPLKEALIER